MKHQLRNLFFLSAFALTTVFSPLKLTAQIDPCFIGEWCGVVEQVGFGTYETVMHIDSLVLNTQSGFTEYPPLECEGDNIFLEVVDTILVFSETITTPGSTCVDGIVEIYKIHEDTIQWNWYFENDTEPTTFGQLARKGPSNVNQLATPSLQFSGVFPIPLREEASFSLQLDQSEQISIALYDIQGRLVQPIFIGTMLGQEEKSFLIDGGDIDAGIYILGIQGDRTRHFARISIQ